MREPDAHDGAGILAITLALFCIVGILSKLGDLGIWSGLLLEAGFLAIPLLFARWTGLSPLRSSGFSRLSIRQVTAILTASLGSMWLLKGLVDFQHSVMGMDTTGEREQIGKFIESMGGLGPGMILLVIVPALCEETLFRGILLRGFAAQFSPFRALVYTTGLFAIMHANAGLARPMLMVFLGMYFGTVVWLTGSLWAGVLAHAINNGATLLILRMYGERVYDMHPSWGMLGMSALVFTSALVYLAVYRKADNTRVERKRTA